MSDPALTSRTGARPPRTSVRRRACVVVLLSALVASLASTGGCAGAERPPDVVLVVADTLRADRLSAYGYERPTSPRVDRLAAEGTLFEDVTSQFSWTVPSMISIFTGHYLTGARVELLPAERTLAQAFRRAGYATVGASANVLVQRDTGLGRGFEHFSAPDPEETDLADRSLSELLESVRAPLELVLGAEDRRPVLLYLHAMEPHDPYRELEGEVLPGEPRPLAPPGRHAAELARRGLSAQAETLLARAARARDRYDDEVRRFDRELERTLAELDALGLLDDAVVALAADHGEGLWDHASPAEAVGGDDPLGCFYQKHGAIQYQEVVAAPLVLWGRGVPAGLRVAAPVENVDLFPTLTELAGLPPRGKLHGRSLVPLLRGADRPHRTHVFSHGVGTASVREVDSGLKLVVRFASGGDGRAVASAELYDLAADPGEHADLASARPRDVHRLRGMLDAWRAAYPVPVVVSTPAELERRLAAIGYTAEDVGSVAE